MKTSTIIFNAAGILTLLAVLCAVVSLAQNKTTSYGLTPAPTMAPAVVTTAPVMVSTPAGIASVAPAGVVTMAPMMAGTGPFYGYPASAMNTGLGAVSQTYPGANPYSALPPPAIGGFNPYAALSNTPGVPTVNATNTLGTTMGAFPGGVAGM